MWIVGLVFLVIVGIGKASRWRRRHALQSRTYVMLAAPFDLVEKTRSFCSSPTCGCKREKMVAPPLAIVHLLDDASCRGSVREPWWSDVHHPHRPRPAPTSLPGPGTRQRR
jgi:hypothetical protein